MSARLDVGQSQTYTKLDGNPPGLGKDLFDSIRRLRVTGRFKTSHSWALQNQPRLLGVSDTLADCIRLNLLFKRSDAGRLSFQRPDTELDLNQASPQAF